MYSYLYKYFCRYRHIALPGIGSFELEQSNARVDFTEKLIRPGIPLIVYSAANTTPNRNLFYFLSKNLGIDEVDAIRKLNDFTANLKAEIALKESVELPGIGYLRNQGSGLYRFEPERNVDIFYPQLTAERVIRKSADHLIRVGEQEKTFTEMEEQLGVVETKKDRWWIPALILAAIGIVAIVIYYAS